jgi:hypothetical protein
VGTRYRVWIVRYEGWRPEAWHDMPEGAIAIEPAERGTMSVRQAGRYVEAFNRAARNGSQKIWAVALPVAVQYVGDPQPGGILAHEKSPLLACQVSACNGLPPREYT